jgi:signal transduction histidine kinase/DNA-binding response OmpR family regulator
MLGSIDRTLAQAQATLAVIAGDATLEALVSGPADPLTLEIVQHNFNELLVSGPWDALFLVDRSGHVVTRVGDDGAEPSHVVRELARAALDGESRVSDVVPLSANTRRKTIVFAAPVRRGGRVVGALAGEYPWPVIAESLEAEEGEVVELRDHAGRILARDDRRSPGRVTPLFFDKEPLTVEVRQAGYLSYAGGGWTLRVHKKRTDVYAPVLRLARSVGIALALLLVAGIGAIHLVSRRVAAPLKAFSATAKQVSAGDLNARISAPPIQEMEVLADSFNEMVARIQEQMSEQGETERALRGSQDFLRSTIDNIPQIVAVKNIRENRYTLANRAAHRYVPTIIGKTDEDIFGHEIGALNAAQDRKLVEDRATSSEARTYRTPFGHRTFHVSKLPLLDDLQNVESLLIIAEDVTEKLRDEGLRRQAQEAEAANHAKSAFLARMSHEIRTPMNGVLGMASLLAQTPLSAEQREYAETIHSSAVALLDVINDILDLSRIESGKVVIHPEPFPLRAMLADSLKVVTVAAAQKSLEMVIDIDPALPDDLIGDASRLRQMIVNLVSNAVKFTEQGEVVVSVSGERRGKDSLDLLFAVRDTGCGIPPEDIERVFEPFEQKDSSTSRSHGGTGLGLPITRRLAEQMGGSAWALSEPGSGSTFFFMAQCQLSAAAPSTGNDELRGKRLFVVAQNPATCNAVARMLTAREASVRSFTSCDAAEEACQREATLPLDHLVIDARWSGACEGDSVRRAIANGVLADRIVVLLEATRLHAMAEEFQPMGVHRFVVKPVSEQQLITALLGEPAAPAQPQAATATAPLPLRILLAEDNLVNQRVATRFLERDGHSVVVASNGREAVAEFQRQSFDAVLMDIEMPEMDGIAATAEIRKLEERVGHHTPVIALTAHATEGDRERCLAARMDDYVSKPIERQELRKAMAKVMETTRPGRAA